MVSSKKKPSKKAAKAKATCTFTCDEVAGIVLDVLREKFGDDEIQADSDFEDDIGADGDAKKLLFIPIRKALKRDGCNLNKFSPTTCEKADTPQDIIDVICKDFGVE
jgi:hypothetical protein